MLTKEEKKFCVCNGSNADPEKVFSHLIKESVCLHWFGNVDCKTVQDCPGRVCKHVK